MFFKIRDVIHETIYRFDVAALGVRQFAEAFNRRQHRLGTSGTVKDVRFQFFEKFLRSRRVEADFQVGQSLDAVFQIFREVIDAALFRETGNHTCQATQFAAPFEKRDLTTDFGSRAGRFKTRCATTDDDDMDVAVYFMRLVIHTVDDVRVDGTTDRLGFGNSMIGTADVAADALVDLFRLACHGFAAPVRVGDEAAADGDEIGLAFSNDLIGYFRIADVAGDDDRFVEFLPDLFRQVCPPAVRKVTFVDLVLDRIVNSCRNIYDIDFRFDVFEEFQRIVNGVSAFDEFISRKAEGMGTHFPTALRTASTTRRGKRARFS